MPSHKVHRKLDEIVLGRPYDVVHKFKDAPYKVLGKRHRVLFHDPYTNFILGLLFGYKAMISGFLHDLADKAETCMKMRKRRIMRG